MNNAFVAASNGTISYATRSYGSYVGHYVDNISMNVYEEQETEDNTNPSTGDAGFAVALVMVLASMVILKKERKKI